MHKNMYYKNLIIDIFAVTFRKEGVDWNFCLSERPAIASGHLPQGRCGLKLRTYKIGKCPSCHLPQGRCGLKSPNFTVWNSRTTSPSARKVWIEIINSIPFSCKTSVTFRKEGVDWNWKYRAVRSGADVTFRKEGVDWNHPGCNDIAGILRHLPQGRCGLKCYWH